MEKASWHSQQYVISFIISSSVKSVGSISTACVQGRFSNADLTLTHSRNMYLTLTINTCSVSSPFTKGREFVLWLWDAHNKVNDRLMKLEASLGNADPQFPKIIWPPRELCPSCYLSASGKDDVIKWDHDEVYKFLIKYYGKKLVSLYKDKEELVKSRVNEALTEDLTASASVNAVVVPVGAALAIAIASCAFGALACYWRQQQKSRKYKYHLHSFKNI